MAGEEGNASKTYVVIDGFKLSPFFDPEAYWSIKRYKPEDGEVFLVTYPKCGTTWMAQIIHLIYSKGDAPLESLLNSLPFLEWQGTEALEATPKPFASRMHLPFSHIPWSDRAKYIYVTRNPKDCLFSYYHFLNPNTDFDQFFEDFVKGEIPCGDYFEHVLTWYEHRNDPNVLFITYESMKKDIKSVIIEVARHLGEEHLKAVTDEAVMANIIKHSSIEYMRKHSNGNLQITYRRLLGKHGEDIDSWPITKSMKYTFKSFKGIMQSDPQGELIRKGEVGDGKANLTAEQNKKLDDMIADRLKGTDILTEWNEIGCLK